MCSHAQMYWVGELGLASPESTQQRAYLGIESFSLSHTHTHTHTHTQVPPKLLPPLQFPNHQTLSFLIHTHCGARGDHALS